MSLLRRLSGVPELVERSGDDPYVRASADAAQVESAWATDEGALGWLAPSHRAPERSWLVALGPPAAAARLVREVVEGHGIDVSHATLPRDADRLLPTSYTLRPRNDWEWFFTISPPTAQEREREVAWLDDTAAAEDIRRFLHEWSPRHDAEPGEEHVRRWCGVRDDAGRLVATAAHTEYTPGVPFLASIATHGGRRGQGYGAAVTAWITRRLLEEGAGWVTLGMYSDNDVARRVYERLGFRCTHRFTSGRLVSPRPETP